MTEYYTIQGDTFDIIALKTLGDEGYMGAIIEANPTHAETVIFSRNVKLAIPDELPLVNEIGNLPPWRTPEDVL